MYNWQFFFNRLLHNSKMYISVFQRKQMYFSMYSDERTVSYTEKINVYSCFALLFVFYPSSPLWTVTWSQGFLHFSIVRYPVGTYCPIIISVNVCFCGGWYHCHCSDLFNNMLVYFVFSYPVCIEWWILTLTTWAAPGITTWRNRTSSS